VGLFFAGADSKIPCRIRVFSAASASRHVAGWLGDAAPQDIGMTMSTQRYTSTIAPSVIDAYSDTEFRVLGEAPFSLRVGQPCAALVSSLLARRVDCAAFITAANPCSRQLTDLENRESLALLAAELGQRSLHFTPGLGIHPSGNWPGEESFLVYGLALQAAKALGTTFKQNAIVWAGLDAVPRLVLLR
jgi:Protein of unknown function (DUF3293)